MNKELAEKVCSFHEATGYVLRENMENRDNLIRVKYHSDNVPHLEMSEVGDWIDLYTAEEVTMEAGDFKLISLGVSMQLPFGYEAHIVPRSSTFKKWSIIQANSIGIIDSTYCGDNDVWMFPAIALDNVTIPAETRICQFRIVPTMRHDVGDIEFVSCEHLDNVDRGGFGSTGE